MPFQNDVPGPGTYGIGGVPHAAMEEKSKKSASTVGILDAGASSKRNLPAVVRIHFISYPVKSQWIGREPIFPRDPEYRDENVMIFLIYSFITFSCTFHE